MIAVETHADALWPTREQFQVPRWQPASQLGILYGSVHLRVSQ